MTDDVETIRAALAGDGRGVDRLLALDALDRLAEENAAKDELLRAAVVYFEHFVAADTALADGFDLAAWCDRATALAREEGSGGA